MFRCIIYTPQNYTDYETMQSKCSAILANKQHVHIIAAAEKNSLALQYVKQNSLPVTVVKQDFQGWGPQAVAMCYKQMADNADAAIIFTDGESKKAFIMERECNDRKLPVRVVRYESLKQEIDRLTKEGKIEKRKRVTVSIADESKQRYFQAHEGWYKRQYPTGYADGFYTKPKLPAINSGSRMDLFIINFLVWSGWNATKVKTMGRKLPNGKWAPSTTKVGSQDIACTIKGRSVRLETKHGKDTVKPAQLKQQDRERNAGGISEVVYSVEDFFLLYDKILNDKL